MNKSEIVACIYKHVGRTDDLENLTELAEEIAKIAAEEEREACAACVPATWLDPMLAGEKSVIFNRAREGAVEAVLIAVRDRIKARSNVK